MVKNWMNCALIAGISLLALPCFAADWPHLAGPGRNGQSAETGLAASWGEAGPGTLWTATVSPGFGGVSVHNDEVFMLDRVDDAQDVLRCWDLESGAEKWRYEYESPGKPGFPGSRTPPTLTDSHVYTVGLMGQMHCIDRATREVVWQKDLRAAYGVDDDPVWGVSQSPVLYKSLVIVAPQGNKAALAALDAATGAEVWTTPPQGGYGYSSPVVHTLCGVDQAVMVTATGDRDATEGKPVFGVNLDDGSVLWRYTNWRCIIPIPFAAVMPGDRLFITGEYGAGSAMIRIVKDGDNFSAEEVFKTDLAGSQIHQPLLIGDHLYMNSNGNSRNDGMLCMTLDGEVKWNTGRRGDDPNFERGNLIVADGKIYNLDGRTGILHLIAPSPEGYQELDQAQVLDSRQMWSPLALSNGKLLVRGQDTLKCLDVAAK